MPQKFQTERCCVNTLLTMLFYPHALRRFDKRKEDRHSDNLIAQGSLKQKCRDNFAAIELMQKLDGEGRAATEEENRALVKYVGWGGIPQVFAWHDTPDWHAELENDRAAYADSASSSAKIAAGLAGKNVEAQICEQGTRAAALTEEQKNSNRGKFRVRSRGVSHAALCTDQAPWHPLHPARRGVSCAHTPTKPRKTPSNLRATGLKKRPRGETRSFFWNNREIKNEFPGVPLILTLLAACRT